MPDAQSRALAADAGYCAGLRSIDEGARSALRSILQPALQTERHAVGRSLPLMRRGIRILCARLLPIHRAKPGPRVPRCEAGRLPVVKLPRKFRRPHRIPAVASSRIPGFGRTSRRAIYCLPRPFRACARAIASGEHSKSNQWRLPARQRILQVGGSNVPGPKGGAGAARPAKQGSTEIGL